MFRLVVTSWFLPQCIVLWWLSSELSFGKRTPEQPATVVILSQQEDFIA